MDENTFVKQDATWQPPNKGMPNPYRQAKIVKQVVEVAPLVVLFPTADFEPTERASPYVSAEEYQAQTGVKLSAENASLPPDQNLKKITAGNWSATRCVTFPTAAPIASAVSVFLKFLWSEWRLLGETICKS